MNQIPNGLRASLADRYRIERELGQGGMATVYLAEDFKHHRKVAIKVPRPELAAVIGAERFLREIQTIANLQHPHILGLIYSGMISLGVVTGDPTGRPYYVMPFVEGESLRNRLAREEVLFGDGQVGIWSVPFPAGGKPQLVLKFDDPFHTAYGPYWTLSRDRLFVVLRESERRLGHGRERTMRALAYSRLKPRLGYLPLKRRVTVSLKRLFSRAAGLPARGEEEIVSGVMTPATDNQLFIRVPNPATA